MRSTLVLALLVMSGCSDSPSKKAEEKAAPEPVTGLHALAQMYNSARTWAPDVQILRVISLQLGSDKLQPGKAPAWQATFVSPTLGQSRVYTYANADLTTTLHEGIKPDPAASYSARGQSAQPFVIQAAKKDTDELYATALEHGKEYNDAHPGTRINYLLELNNRSSAAAWRIMWGDSPSSSAFSVLLDASTGTFLEVLH